MDRQNNTLEKIRNRDAEFCGKVPLHQTNLVQPHGVLLIVQKENYTILQASENADQLFRIAATDVAQTSLSRYIAEAELATLQSRFDKGITEKLPFTFTINNKKFLALIQSKNGYFIFEVEELKGDGEHDSFAHVYQNIKHAMATVEAAATTEAACTHAVQELKELSGFDKVMIYRFDEDCNGEVIAEAAEAGMESYLGLKFPASDIPKQARELYRKNPYRLIPDRAYKPIKLFPVINPLTHSFTDLTDSNLRSVAAVHLEYLRNMNVAASMSTRILVNGTLWGLIACHHRTARYLSYQECSVFELLSGIISAKITAVQQSDAFTFKESRLQVLAKVMEQAYRSGDLIGAFRQQQEQLLQLLSANGITIMLNKHLESFGTTPQRSKLQDLIYWLQTRSVFKIYQQPGLSGAYEGAEEYAEIASGLLALPIQPDKGSYILAFRPEAVRTVNWGGNPAEALQFEPDRKNYHPRKSFQLWQETVRNTAIPWTEKEMEIAENLRIFVVEFILKQALTSRINP